VLLRRDPTIRPGHVLVPFRQIPHRLCTNTAHTVFLVGWQSLIIEYSVRIHGWVVGFDGSQKYARKSILCAEAVMGSSEVASQQAIVEKSKDKAERTSSDSNSCSINSMLLMLSSGVALSSTVGFDVVNIVRRERLSKSVFR
jgi:hypothetical protein